MNEIDLYFEEEANPVAIANNSMKKAKEGMYDVILFDTAGRLAIDAELMNQLEAIKKDIIPDEIFYVADSMTGQDAVKSAVSFHEKITLSGRCCR